MSEYTKKGATYEDVVAAPDDKVAEIFEGDLYLSPRPTPRHANVTSTLGADLHDAFQRARRGPGGWWILDEPEVHFGHDVLVPDIAGWRREHLPEIPDTAWLEIAPDWLCEVISPSTARVDREKKLPIYAAAGVEYAWIIDPSLKTLEVFRRKGRRFVLVNAHFGETSISAPPFEDVQIDLGPLWA